MKKLLCLVLALALLLSFGCKKDEPVETPDVPETPVETPAPPAEQPPEEQPEPGPEIQTWPDLQPDYIVDEVPAEENADAWEAAFNSYREVGYFVEWQLGDGYTILEVLPDTAYGGFVRPETAPVDTNGAYLMWGMHILEPGVREPFLLRVKVTPDGKDFSLLSKEFVEVTEEWKAVQNYRYLVSNLAGGCNLLERMGYDFSYPEQVDDWNQPIPTDIDYQHFMDALLRIMTQEMYDAHWADFFSNQEGKLAMLDVGGSGFFYAVDMVQPQEDGTYLSYEHYYDFLYNRHDFFVKVDLEAQPNGTFRVAGWDPDNTAIMEQAAQAMPIATGADYDTDGDGQLSAREFPRPTGEALGLTGEDATLYTALSENLLDTAYPENADFGNALVLSSVNLLGKYGGDDGQTHYVCTINDSHFYDAGDDPATLSYHSMGSQSLLARVTLDSEGKLAAFYPTLHGADNTQREKDIFGPLTEQYTAWSTGDIIPGAYRLVPTGEELLELYQDAYFPGI